MFASPDRIYTRPLGNETDMYTIKNAVPYSDEISNIQQIQVERLTATFVAIVELTDVLTAKIITKNVFFRL